MIARFAVGVGLWLHGRLEAEAEEAERGGEVEWWRQQVAKHERSSVIPKPESGVPEVPGVPVVVVLTTLRLGPCWLGGSLASTLVNLMITIGLGAASTALETTQ
jgi:hypothetical protein